MFYNVEKFLFFRFELYVTQYIMGEIFFFFFNGLKLTKISIVNT